MRTFQQVEFAAFACRSRQIGKGEQAPIDATSKVGAFLLVITKKLEQNLTHEPNEVGNIIDCFRSSCRNKWQRFG